MDQSQPLRVRYLTCEKYFIFELLICAGGMMGAYTFNLRGGVFCNAQTANVMLMSLAFGQGRWMDGFYYLIPISAYIAGALISEALPKPVRRMHFLRWDTCLIGFELLALFLIGWIPLSAPVQPVQVAINFLCSMPYNTFRQAEGIPMSTTFVTNHIRQIGRWTAIALHKRDRDAWRMAGKHLRMVAVFFAGGVALTVLCKPLGEKAIWLALLPLGVGFGLLLYADRVVESTELDRKPHGH